MDCLVHRTLVPRQYTPWSTIFIRPVRRLVNRGMRFAVIRLIYRSTASMKKSMEYGSIHLT